MMLNTPTNQRVSYHDFRAMNTGIRLWLDTDPELAAPAFEEAAAIFRDVERALSRFDVTSELSHVNQLASEWVTVSDLLWEVTGLALNYAHETDGVFDPTILNAICAAGYDRSFNVLATDDAPSSVAPPGTSLTGRWQDIRLDSARQAMCLPPDTGLDLGGIAKGYTAHWAAQVMSLWGPSMVEAGGDVMAVGRPGLADGWPVTITTPRREGTESAQPLVSLALSDAALATSGIDHRTWVKDGQQAHHIIDPRTGYPAETDLLTVSAVAENSTTAEIWSKVGLILGLDTLTGRGIPALVVERDRSTIRMNDLMADHIRWQSSEFEISIVHTGAES